MYRFSGWFMNRYTFQMACTGFRIVLLVHSLNISMSYCEFGVLCQTGL